MNEYIKILFVITSVILYGCVGVGAVNKEELSNNTVSATTTPMMMVSKEVLLEAIRQAKEEDGYLPVAIYEYNKQMDLWDRASLDCIKERVR